MRSRIVFLPILMLVSVGLLFAGGEGEDGASGGPVPVTLWLPGGAQGDQEAVNQAAMEYAGPIIGAYPEVQFFGWGEWADRKQLAIQSGEELDIMFTASWNNFFQELERNAWLPLNDLIDEHAPGLYETVGFFFDGPVRDGTIYAVPTVKEGADSSQWILNGELVEAYGVPIDEIVTPEDLEPYLATILANEPDVIPYLIDGVSNLPVSTLRNTWNSIGVGPDFRWFEDTQSVQYVWHREEAWERAEMQRDWYLAGYFQPEIEDVGGEHNADRYWETGNWFAYSHVGHPGKTGELAARWGYPIVGTGPIEQPLVTTEILLGAMMAISRTSTKSVESIKVLELMNNDRVFNNLLNYGIEGTHFNFVDETAGVIEAIDGSGYAPNMQWALQNQFNTYLYANEDPDKWVKYAEFNETARISPVVGFTADQSSIRTQLAAIENVKDRFNELAVRGLVDTSEIREEYLAALQEVGVDEVEEELTRQVRAFLASQ